MFFISDQPPGEGGRMPAGAQGPFPLGGGADWDGSAFMAAGAQGPFPMRGGAHPMFGTRYVPDPSITPPDAVQALIDGDKGDIISCGHCSQPGATLRCGRCKCVKYCSADCQKLHFAIHKKNCKVVKKQKDAVDSLLAQCADPGSNYSTVTAMIKLGNLLVNVGYQESDTVANGRLYYQEALRAFTQPMMVYKNSYHHALSISVEDKVLLLIVALGGGDQAIKAWCEESEITGENPNPHDPERVLTDKSERWWYFESVEHQGSDESVAYDTAMCEALGINIRGMAHDDITFHVISLFNSMKSLSEHRENLKRLDLLEDEMAKDVAANNAPVHDISKAVLPYLENHGARNEEDLAKKIQAVLCVIRHNGHEGSLVHLRDDIPLREEHAPKFFRPGVHTGDTTGREYLWMILQDLFFETQGVNNILNEFLPEDENWDNAVD
ncbi:hypothetical protein ACHAXT_010347 [Thalassiosira profunda]